jgi:hypothetical protein
MFAMDPTWNPADSLGGHTRLESSNSGSFPKVPQTSDAAMLIGLGSGAAAFGVLLGNIDAEPSGIFIIHLSTGEMFDVSSDIFSPAFFGFVSTTPVSWLTITQLGSSGLGPWNMESPSVSIVPEPASATLFGSAALALAAALFFRKVREYPSGESKRLACESLGERAVSLAAGV